MRGYRELSEAGGKRDLLGAKTRELTALTVAVSLGAAIAVNAGAALVYSARAMDAYTAKAAPGQP